MNELIPFSCAYGECDHERDDECPAHKDFICQECTDALDDDAACVIWDDYDHQVALIGSADPSDAERQRVYESMRRVDDELERQDPHAEEQTDCGGWEDH